MDRFFDSPVLFFAVGCVAGFDIYVIARAIFG